jgi:hypothetical protein
MLRIFGELTRDRESEEEETGEKPRKGITPGLMD